MTFNIDLYTFRCLTKYVKTIFLVFYISGEISLSASIRSQMTSLSGSGLKMELTRSMSKGLCSGLPKICLKRSSLVRSILCPPAMYSPEMGIAGFPEKYRLPSAHNASMDTEGAGRSFRIAAMIWDYACTFTRSATRALTRISSRVGWQT